MSESTFYSQEGHPPPPPNASNVRQHENAENRAAAEIRRRATDLRVTVENPASRRVLARILSECGIYHATSSSDPTVMARENGRRQVGLWLLEQLGEADPTAYMLIQRDAIEARRVALSQEIRDREWAAAHPMLAAGRRVARALGI